jgi:hypothetical protein
VSLLEVRRVLDVEEGVVGSGHVVRTAHAGRDELEPGELRVQQLRLVQRVAVRLLVQRQRGRGCCLLKKTRQQKAKSSISSQP